MLLGVAFTVLLLLISGVSAVLSPKSVKLSCQNLDVSVSWEYSKQKPETIFRVHVGGSAGHLESDTTEQQYDLSHFVWASEERYLGFHYVTVTAKEGGSQSKSISSETFTFNHLIPANISCDLDFPPVDLSETGSGATVSFVNPLLFYTELKEAAKSDSATFAFTVSSNDGDRDGACTAREEICKLDISFPEGAEKCVNKMTGWLYDGSFSRYVEFRETGRLCASKSTDVHMLLLIILLVVLASVSSVIIIAICLVKAWTQKVPYPKPIPLPPNPDPRPKYAHVSHTNISHVTVEGRLLEGYERDEDSADDSEKTEIVSMDVEVEGASVYDSPHSHEVDMGNGDMATCYQGEVIQLPRGQMPRGLDLG